MARKLRIAASVFFGVVTVALCVLWVRSYWKADLLAYTRGQTYVAVGSGRGIAFFQWRTCQPFVKVGNKLGWEFLCGPAGTIDAGLKPLEWKRDADPATAFGLFISIPCWCCMIFVAALPVVTWCPYRISLRTLLIATTLVAVVLGLAVWLAS